MEDNSLEQILVQFNEFTEDQSPANQLKFNKQINELLADEEKLLYDVRKTIKSFRAAAEELDSIHRNGNIARATGSFSGVIGGALTVGAGIATMMTAGAAAPLFFAGIAFGGIGLVTGLGGNFREAYKRSKEIKKADQDWNRVVDGLERFNKKVEDMKKKGSVLETIFKYLNPTLKSLPSPGCYPSGQALSAMKKFIKDAATDATKEGIDDAVKPFVKMSAKNFGRLIIVVGAVFTIWDVKDTFTSVMDVVQKKGCKAANVLRYKAEELERLSLELEL